MFADAFWSLLLAKATRPNLLASVWFNLPETTASPSSAVPTGPRVLAVSVLALALETNTVWLFKHISNGYYVAETPTISPTYKTARERNLDFNGTFHFYKKYAQTQQ